MNDEQTISPQEHAVSILRVYVDHFDNPESPLVLPRGVLEDVVRRVDYLYSSRNDLLGALERIANYQMPDEMQDTAEDDYGLDPEEAIGMAYENVIWEAQAALSRAKAGGDA